jgi:hypothetical protein
VARGEVVTPSVGPTRTGAHFQAEIRQTVESNPAAPKWHFVVDNRNIPMSEALVRHVAQECGIETDLGEVEKRGDPVVDAQPGRLLEWPDPQDRLS